ncbi:hypothetical protein PMIN06_002888 [Paraphaeosphaeria minitans]
MDITDAFVENIKFERQNSIFAHTNDESIAIKESVQHPRLGPERGIHIPGSRKAEPPVNNSARVASRSSPGTHKYMGKRRQRRDEGTRKSKAAKVEADKAKAKAIVEKRKSEAAKGYRPKLRDQRTEGEVASGSS